MLGELTRMGIMFLRFSPASDLSEITVYAPVLARQHLDIASV
jgi:hypothetical protein